MIRLICLGGIELRGSGGELRGILTQPKRLALLVRLAAERPGTFLRRDTLLALFWPELDSAGARNALRQALFHLRRELGDGVLVNRGDEEVGLDPARIKADCSEFEEAAGAGRWREALALLRGDLAPGLFVSDASGFEEWLEGRRADLRCRAAAGALELSREAEAAAAWPEAAAWARRAAELAPDDESIVRRLLSQLLRAGDAAGAARTYEAFERRLEREFGVTPSEETRAIRATLSGPSTVAPQASDPPLTPPPATEVAPPAVTPARSMRLRWGLLALGALALAVVAGRWRLHDAPGAPSDETRLLIAPFRAPQRDTLLDALSVGLVELLNARLSGTRPPHPVDPDVALRAVAEARASGAVSDPQALLGAAHRVGAGHVIAGTLVRESGRLVLAPVAIEVRTGRVSPLAPVSGPVDSLPWMVDRVAVSILSSVAGEDGADAPALGSIPLPALRAYLDGRQAMREGRLADATVALAHALEIDSTFALAARDYAEALDWAGEDPWAVARNRAWRLRDGLGPRDRAILVALNGRRWPRFTPVPEQIADWEEAVRWAPDRSRAWFGLGDVLFHAGDLGGIRDAQDRARHAFDRALALDSTSVPVVFHRLEMAAREGDTGTTRRLLPYIKDEATPGEVREFVRWRSAAALGDSVALRAARDGFDTLSEFALLRIAGWGQLDALGMSDPAAASRILTRRARTSAESSRAFQMESAVAGNRGEVGRFLELVEPFEGSAMSAASAVLYAAGDAVRARMSAVEAAVASGADTSTRARDAVQLWRLWAGDTLPGVEVRHLLTLADREPGDVARAATACLAALRLAGGESRTRLRRADSLIDLVSSGDQLGSATLIGARCHELAGDRAGALAMVIRRPLDPVYGPRYLAGYLYEEGRLAALEGDRARAVRAWRQFLVLRDDPDPALRAQVTEVSRLVDSLSRN